MRINNPLLVHKVAAGRARHARMINELFRQPDPGFIHAEMWFSRTIILVQYQRNEIEARDKSRLAEATDRANDAITRLFGPGPVDGKIEAIVVVAER